ncbi:MAG: FAD-dependent oxidoreductase [Tabrizicola sp.]|uniref:NAD(P)/FAD-dependent oxidoreductase n=1 Tax=Tabrizicola sp. TaxID=2005166 RepID=UPI002732B813|nr:FAD-dependent oxidoreductase [Tabrizicola sp.]MDP3262418.1 FAD-dependent oxidoreductase [Tabrizicola sp.]MDP3647835.1 FAD-dependent oxidoreductase [Paracoccaceae bacterium]MDZ4068801.1 FAD-dependent oxidoreductase [Tabrizicola sp.]
MARVDVTVDVTVRGAGIFGLSIAFACARRGARVRVIDPGGVGAGSSGGLVGALAPHVPEAWNGKKQFQLESLLMAEGWWAEVGAVSGLATGYLRSGRLQPLMDARAVEVARGREVTAAALWGDAAVWRVEDAPAGWGPVSATGLVVRDTLTARLSPRIGLAALAGAVVALGGEVVRDGTEAGAVVDATGVAGLAALSGSVGRAVGGGVKGQAAALRFDAAGWPQVFADALHIVPHVNGTVAIGSTSESAWQDLGTDAALEALIAQAVAAVPMLEGAAVVERWAGVRPRARSRAPMLGPWPGRPGWFVANGGFKIGFGMAPKVAEVMADLVLERRDGVPDGFRVEASL